MIGIIRNLGVGGSGNRPIDFNLLENGISNSITTSASTTQYSYASIFYPTLTKNAVLMASFTHTRGTASLGVYFDVEVNGEWVNVGGGLYSNTQTNLVYPMVNFTTPSLLRVRFVNTGQATHTLTITKLVILS